MDLIQFKYTISGLDIYFLARNTEGEVWQTTTETWVAYVGANYLNYETLTVEDGSSRNYKAAIPTAWIAGEYYLDFCMYGTVVGPLEGDVLVGWDVIALSAQSTIRIGEDMRGTDSAYTGTPPTVAEVADAVWDELLADHVTANSSSDVLADVKKLLRADKVIDTSENPWQVNHYVEGTLVDPLMTKTMKNTSGEAVASTNHVLGQLEQA